MADTKKRFNASNLKSLNGCPKRPDCWANYSGGGEPTKTEWINIMNCVNATKYPDEKTIDNTLNFEEEIKKDCGGGDASLLGKVLGKTNPDSYCASYSDNEIRRIYKALYGADLPEQYNIFQVCEQIKKDHYTKHDKNWPLSLVTKHPTGVTLNFDKPGNDKLLASGLSHLGIKTTKSLYMLDDDKFNRLCEYLNIATQSDASNPLIVRHNLCMQISQQYPINNTKYKRLFEPPLTYCATDAKINLRIPLLRQNVADIKKLYGCLFGDNVNTTTKSVYQLCYEIKTYFYDIYGNENPNNAYCTPADFFDKLSNDQYDIYVAPLPTIIQAQHDELQRLLAEKEQLEQERDDARTDMNTWKQDYNKKNAELKRMQKNPANKDNIAQLKAHLEKLKRNIKDADKRNDELSTRITDLTGQVSRQAAEIEELQRKNVQLETETRRLVEERDVAQAQLTTIKKNIGNATKRKSRVEIDRLTKDKAALEQKLRDIEAQATQLLDKNAQLLQDNARVDELQKQVAKLGADNHNLQTGNDGFVQKNKDLQQQALRLQQEQDAIKQRWTAANARVSTCQRDLLAANQKASTTDDQLAELQHKYDDAVQQKKDAENSLKALQQQAQKHLDDMKQLEQENTALRYDAANAWQDAQAEAEKLVQEQKDATYNLNRANQEIERLNKTLELYKKGHPDMTKLKKDLAVANNEKQQVEEKLTRIEQNADETIKRLTAENVNLKEAQANAEKYLAERDGALEQLRDLNKKITQLETRMSSQDPTLAIEQLQQQLTAANRKKQQAEDNLIEINNVAGRRLDELQRENAAQKETISECSQSNHLLGEELNDARAQLNNKIDESRKLAEQLVKAKQKAQADHKEASEKYNLLEQKASALTKKQRETFANLEKKKNDAEQKLREIENKATDQLDLIKFLQQQVSELQQRQPVNPQTDSDLQRQVVALITERYQAVAGLRALEQRYRAAEEQVSSLKTQLTSLQDDRNAIYAQLQTDQSDKQNLTKQFQQLTKQSEDTSLKLNAARAALVEITTERNKLESKLRKCERIAQDKLAAIAPSADAASAASTTAAGGGSASTTAGGGSAATPAAAASSLIGHRKSCAKKNSKCVGDLVCSKGTKRCVFPPVEKPTTNLGRGYKCSKSSQCADDLICSKNKRCRTSRLRK